MPIIKMRTFLFLALALSLLTVACNKENDEGAWKKLSAFPGDKVYFTSVVYDEKAFIFFGEMVDDNLAIKNYSNSVWVYDSKNDNWETLSPFQGELRSKSTGFTIGNSIYIVGGESTVEGELTELNEVLKYDLQNDTWETLSVFPGTPRAGGLAFVVNERVFYGFGYESGGIPLYDLWEFLPDTDQWEEIPSFPGLLPSAYYIDYSTFVLNSQLVNFTYNNTILLVTGEYYSSPEMWSFNTENLEWTLIENLNFSDDFPNEIYYVRGGSVTFNLNDKCYFLLGSQLNNNMVGTGGLHEFDPLTSTWRVLNVNKPFKGRSGAFAIVTNDGVVIGSGYSQYSGYELWKYRP